MKYIFLYPVYFFILIQSTFSQNNIRYGLGFRAYEVEKEERTSLNLTPDAPLSFSDGFTMEFDVLFNKAHYSFGYIFRIIAPNNEHIDFLLSRTRNSSVLEPQLTTIYKSGQVLCNQTFKELGVDFNEWIHVKLTIDCKKETFSLFINDIPFEITEDYFARLGSITINFGKNNNITYQTSDVPSMALKDIKIKKLNERELYHWKLDQHTNDGVYDQIDKRLATCENPNWLMDYHTYWRKTTGFTTGSYPQIAFDAQRNEIGITDSQHFYIYDIAGEILENHTFTDGFPSGSKANQLLYNSVTNKYFTYNFADEPAVFDPESKSWNNFKKDPVDPVYWHHNRYFSAADTSLYAFGGYGFHIYKNDIHRYHFPLGRWQQLSYNGDTQISPRYLGGLGYIDDNTLLLFGGYGSEEGNQELSPRNYYDLYTYDIPTSTATKIWELDPTQHNFVVANSLVVDTLDNCFYALCYPHQRFNTYLQLYRFALDKPQYEILADSIPYQFNDNHSYADLYLNTNKKVLVAITSFTDEKASRANISVYTLDFPPLNKIDLLQTKPQKRYVHLIIIAILILGIVIFGGYKIIKNKQHKRTQSPKVFNPETVYESSGMKNMSKKDKKQSILLFGGYQVFDKHSNIITAEFTPILKQLFLLILLYTLKDGKGISSVKLREILWFDKSNESAKNNRGVSLSKLRIIFEKIGEISIVSKNSYWVLQFGDDIYCDYYEALILMERLNTHPEIKDIKRLVSIVSAGELLPNLQTDWVDPFKSDFSNKLIDLLLKLISQSAELALSPSLKIDIADAIFAHDSLNEDALKIKCTLLVQMGKNGLAQKVYASFLKEYHTLFGTEFKVTFEQIIT